MKKLHLKHIVPGFLYSIEIWDQDTQKYVVDNRLCIEFVDENKESIKVYSCLKNVFYTGSRKAIFEGIEKGTLKNLNDEKYSNEGKKEYKKLTKENVSVNVGQSLKKLLNK